MPSPEDMRIAAREAANAAAADAKTLREEWCAAHAEHGVNSAVEGIAWGKYAAARNRSLHANAVAISHEAKVPVGPHRWRED